MGIWSQASALAAKTPEERNRYVDFLRAVSILVVIIGHWLIATAHYADGAMTPGHLLKSHPQVQWLTWLFQVMPIFFIVGGYSNGVSLESAERKGFGYGGWLAGRLNRLVTPLLALLVFWGGTAFIMEVAGVRPAVITYVSQASLIPTWFLAIYIMLVILAPLAYKLWKRFGVTSFWGFVALAVLTDVAFFRFGWQFLGWGNYFWVWLAVHQLGFAWRDGKIRRPAIMLVYSATGFAILYLAIEIGPYPLAMVGSPDEGLSNTLPPKATLLALALFQFGLLMAIEGPMRKVLGGLAHLDGDGAHKQHDHDRVLVAHHGDDSSRRSPVVLRRIRVPHGARVDAVVADATGLDCRTNYIAGACSARAVDVRTRCGEGAGQRTTGRTANRRRDHDLPGNLDTRIVRLQQRRGAAARLGCTRPGRRRRRCQRPAAYVTRCAPRISTGRQIAVRIRKIRNRSRSFSGRDDRRMITPTSDMKIS